ncbi:MAG: FAD-dependent oxidoreductase [Nitrososphaeria archaeon]
MEKPDSYDVIIIGAGIAGLTAGIYAARRGLRTLIISKDIGGQALIAKEIENYPAVDKASGVELVQKAYEQSQKFGAELIIDEVKKVEKEHEGLFRIKVVNSEYLSKAVIIASGKIPQDLGVVGEDKFRGNGLSYCATCDAPLYKNKRVVVVGDGAYAYDAAILLSKYAAEVVLITRRKELSGERELVEAILKSQKIKVLYETKVKGILGTFKVKSITLETSPNIEYNMPTDGLFVEMGYAIKVEPFKDLVDLDERKQVVINNRNETSTSGVFAAGDVTNTPYKQFVISASEGAKAALSAYEYIQRLAGKSAVAIDWHK